MVRTTDRWLGRAAAAAALATAAAACAVLAFVALSAVPLVASGDVLAVVSGRWRPTATPPQHGIAPMIAGSLVLAAFAVALALPAAIGVCAFVRGVAPMRLGRLVMAVVHLMTGIPTVVYGFASVILLVPLVRALPGGGSGFSLLAGGLTLALLVLPTVVLVLEARLAGLDAEVRVTCAALGLSQEQAFTRVALPLARRGLAAAAVLGFCRATGDTLVALMVAGNAPQFPTSPFDPVRTLTSHVALVLATDWDGPEHRSVAAAGLLLFLLTACAATVLRRRFAVRASVLDHADRG